MKISIIIPSFNDKRIIRTVKSILAQDFDRDKFEIIIMDGGSDNNSFASTFNFLENNCNLVISKKDKGIFDGLNKGIEIVKGELVFMIGSDDYLISPDVFTRAFKEYENNNHLIIFELFYVNQKDQIERHWSMPKNLKSVPPYFQLPHFSTFVSKELIGDTRFKLDSFISADFGFFKDLIKKKKSCSIINTPSICMTSGGQSSKNLLNILKGNLQSLKEFNFNPYLILMFLVHKIFTKTKHFASMRFNKKQKNKFQNKINLFLDSIN